MQVILAEMYILAGCWYFNASLYWHWVSSRRTTCKQLVYARKRIITLPRRVFLTDQFNNLSFPLSRPLTSLPRPFMTLCTSKHLNRNLVKSTSNLLDVTAVTEREDLVEMTELPRPLGIKLFWHQTYPLSRVTHLSGMNYTAVDLPALLLLLHALPLNRKSMSHFALLSSSLWWFLPSFIHSVFFWSPDRSDVLSYSLCLFCCCLFLFLYSLAVTVSGCRFLSAEWLWPLRLSSPFFSLWSPWVLSLVAMVIQWVKWCWVIVRVSPGSR